MDVQLSRQFIVNHVGWLQCFNYAKKNETFKTHLAGLLLQGVSTVDIFNQYYFARDILGTRWPEAEPVILQKQSVAFSYKRDVVKGAWEEYDVMVESLENPPCIKF